MTDERPLDMEERIDEVLARALLPKLLMAVEIDVDVDFMVLFPAAPVDSHIAAVCVNVTPAGVQIPLAYLRVAAREREGLALVSRAHGCRDFYC
jgi:hypothetical protein